MLFAKDEKVNIKELIKGLGVFELRGVARQLGISSPTTKKRDELILLINQSLDNGAVAQNTSQKRGRPYKQLNVLDNIRNKINSETILMDFSNTQKTVNFAQEANFTIDDDICEGIIKKSNYSIEMYDLKTGAKVKFDKIDYNDELLATGDKVKTTVNLIDDVYHANKILEINNQDFEDYRSKFVDKGDIVISNEVIPFALGKAVEGRRNVYRLDEELFETTYVENLLNYCESNEIEFVLLATNTSFENEIKFKKIPTENKFIASYGTDDIINYHKVLDAVYYAENLVNRGKKVVLLVADIVEIVKCLESYFSEDQTVEDVNKATKVIMQKMLKFACAYENGVSGTTIMCYNQIDTDDKFLMKDIMKISNKIN